MGQNYFYCQATFNRLANEDFAKKALGKKKEKRMQKVTVEDLKKLGKNAIEVNKNFHFFSLLFTIYIAIYHLLCVGDY